MKSSSFLMAQTSRASHNRSAQLQCLGTPLQPTACLRSCLEKQFQSTRNSSFDRYCLGSKLAALSSCSSCSSIHHWLAAFAFHSNTYSQPHPCPCSMDVRSPLAGMRIPRTITIPFTNAQTAPNIYRPLSGPQLDCFTNSSYSFNFSVTNVKALFLTVSLSSVTSIFSTSFSSSGSSSALIWLCTMLSFM